MADRVGKREMIKNSLLANLDKVGTTQLGALRIRRNLALEDVDVVDWCKARIASADSIVRQGKNWYASVADVVITVNAHSFNIITAHRAKKHKEV